MSPAALRISVVPDTKAAFWDGMLWANTGVAKKGTNVASAVSERFMLIISSSFLLVAYQAALVFFEELSRFSEGE
jgi:hypothetical protein